MQTPSTLIFLVVLVIGVCALALVPRYLRARRENNTPNLLPTEKAKAVFASNDPSTRSPAGSIAERRQVIEEMLEGKEDLPG